MPQYPKFEEGIRNKLIRPQMEQSAQPGYALIMDYDPYSNTASVLMTNKGSDDPGDLYLKVPCPVYMGVQGVAPERGRHCWVAFKDNSVNYPVITHYFNHYYQNIDYDRHTQAINATPRFMFNM